MYTSLQEILRKAMLCNATERPSNTARPKQSFSKKMTWNFYYIYTYICSLIIRCKTVYKRIKYMYVYLSQCSGHQTLDHSPSVFMEEVDLIDDEQSDNLSQLNIPCGLPRDNVPLLWSSHYHLEDGRRNITMSKIIKGEHSRLILIRGLIFRVYFRKLDKGWRTAHMRNLGG